MSDMAIGEDALSGSLCWLVCDGVRGKDAWGFDALSVEFEGERVLTVFTDEGQAEMFAWLVVMEGSTRTVRHGSGRFFEAQDLYSKSCSGGELVSLLVVGESGSGPCADIQKVALDPPPEILFAESMVGLDVDISCISRDAFVEALIGRAVGRFTAEWEKG